MKSDSTLLLFPLPCDIMEETKGTPQTRAKNKYNAKAYDSLRIVVKKGNKDIIKEKRPIILNGSYKEARKEEGSFIE